MNEMQINSLTKGQTLPVMPDLIRHPDYRCLWIPAFAGMTHPESFFISRIAHIRELTIEFRSQVHKHFKKIIQ